MTTIYYNGFVIQYSGTLHAKQPGICMNVCMNVCMYVHVETHSNPCINEEVLSEYHFRRNLLLT